MRTLCSIQGSVGPYESKKRLVVPVPCSVVSECGTDGGACVCVSFSQRGIQGDWEMGFGVVFGLLNGLQFFVSY